MYGTWCLLIPVHKALQKITPCQTGVMPQHHYGLPTYLYSNHPTTQMASTKQTPHKCTGGKAPCVKLATKATHKAVHHMGEKKKPHGYCQGIVSLCRFCHYNKSTDLCLQKFLFQSLARKILQGFGTSDKSQCIDVEHFQTTSLLAIQDDMEAFSV